MVYFSMNNSGAETDICEWQSYNFIIQTMRQSCSENSLNSFLTNNTDQFQFKKGKHELSSFIQSEVEFCKKEHVRNQMNCSLQTEYHQQNDQELSEGSLCYEIENIPSLKLRNILKFNYLNFVDYKYNFHSAENLHSSLLNDYQAQYSEILQEDQIPTFRPYPQNSDNVLARFKEQQCKNKPFVTGTSCIYSQGNSKKFKRSKAKSTSRITKTVKFQRKKQQKLQIPIQKQRFCRSNQNISKNVKQRRITRTTITNPTEKEMVQNLPLMEGVVYCRSIPLAKSLHCQMDEVDRHYISGVTPTWRNLFYLLVMILEILLIYGLMSPTYKI